MSNPKGRAAAGYKKPYSIYGHRTAQLESNQPAITGSFDSSSAVNDRVYDSIKAMLRWFE